MGCKGLERGPFLPGGEKWPGAMCGRSWMSKIEAPHATNREYSDGFGPKGVGRYSENTGGGASPCRSG